MNTLAEVLVSNPKETTWREVFAEQERFSNRSNAVRELSFDSFSDQNKKRCEHPKGFNHKLESWSTSDWLTAVCGELGEAANIIKKLNRVRDGIPGNKETESELKASLADEIADTFIYLDLLAQSLGLRMDQIVLHKYHKTSKKIGYAVHPPGCPCQLCLSE